MSRVKKIQTLKNGEWVEWNGSDDVQSIVVTETLTLAELKKYFPEQYKKIKKGLSTN